ncbi:MAG TPA: aminodeoxychorismate/anthranilate synthase component II [Saprospirales bacterium]|nr:aminodeoxychorismate/anthranilate synthase component II [Saprospiraceae bacterium]MDA9325643.1 aminodeoxychorismate/anthranilate synthase component II [bacterium]MDA9333081.1 aminodeoxychorismate/anthranilate synthase component II [Saprospiraceae bacterium]MDA9358364.1 aminodeoxychorismate/anthranilate synthase component II [Saprospiraceae bacterium]HCV51110.1 aminodeoxychorismate/anthranilate synthase component II [Saprospirales bacterium]
MSKTIIIDNYDSFTYNLVQIVNEIQDEEVTVRRNNETTIEEVATFDHIILSPGPGLPEEAGLLKDIIKELGSTHKIFGVCLGLQAIGEVYGAKLKNLDRVFHGIQSEFVQSENISEIFKGVSLIFQAGRYHSWVVDKETISDDLIVTARGEFGEIMAAQHKTHQVYGLQFHPESIMTPEGSKMVENFLKI